MGPISLRVSYRPLRIGLCIEADSLDDFVKAVSLSHVFWGGRFNPIIPCANRELAAALIRAFNVDALYNISGTEAVESLINEYRYIQWPDLHKDLFIDIGSKRQPTLLDVTHPAQHLYETHVDHREKPSIDAAIYTWDQADPLRFVLHSTYGAYPPEADVGRDYSRLFERALVITATPISSDKPLPSDPFRKLTPNYLTTVELETSLDHFSTWDEPGFYYGSAQDFTDLTNFWNLRASDIDLFFYDPVHQGRLRPMIDAYSSALRARPKRHRWSHEVTIWQKDRDFNHDLSIFGSGLSICTFDPAIYNGLNLNCNGPQSFPA